MDSFTPIVEVQQTYLLRLDPSQAAELLKRLDPRQLVGTPLRPVYDALSEAAGFGRRETTITPIGSRPFVDDALA
jgi:hypothetical protein